VVTTRVSYSGNLKLGDGGLGCYPAQQLATLMLCGTIDRKSPRQGSLNVHNSSTVYEKVVKGTPIKTGEEES
jgi:hypothetical protein